MESLEDLYDYNTLVLVLAILILIIRGRSPEPVFSSGGSPRVPAGGAVEASSKSYVSHIIIIYFIITFRSKKKN